MGKNPQHRDSKPESNGKPKKKHGKRNSPWRSIGARDRATSQALQALHNDSRSVYIFADNNGEPVAELLAVMSWRDTVISIPRALIPDRQGGFKLFQLDANGDARPPSTIQKPVVPGYLDHHHLTDCRCGYARSRWSIIRVMSNQVMLGDTGKIKRFKRGGLFSCSYQFFDVPKDVVTDEGYLHRSSLSTGVCMHSPPQFEVDSQFWYYDELLRRLSNFARLANPIPTNDMRRFYQHHDLTTEEFIQLYSSGAVEEDHTVVPPERTAKPPRPAKRTKWATIMEDTQASSPEKSVRPSSKEEDWASVAQTLGGRIVVSKE